MYGIAGRPAGIVVLSAFTALTGLASLLDAVTLAGSTGRGELGPILAAVGVPAAVASVIVGLLLLRRAYRLWHFHHGAWLHTLILVGLKAAFAALSLYQAPASVASWVSLALPLLTGLYLLQPSVRALFAGSKAKG